MLLVLLVLVAQFVIKEVCYQSIPVLEMHPIEIAVFTPGDMLPLAHQTACHGLVILHHMQSNVVMSHDTNVIKQIIFLRPVILIINLDVGTTMLLTISL